MKTSMFSVEDFTPALAIDDVHNQDTFQYSLCCTLWCLVVGDATDQRLASAVRDAINTNGLYSCIEAADTVAVSLLEGSDPEFWNTHVGLWCTICMKSVGCLARGADLEDVPEVDRQGLLMAMACTQILRFPKRFTCVHVDTNSSYENFEQLLRRAKTFSYRTWEWPGQTILQAVRANIREIVVPKYTRHNSKAVRDAVKKFNESFGHFSSGSAFFPFGEGIQTGDTCKIPAYKYGWLLRATGRNCFKNFLGIPDSFTQSAPCWSGYYYSAKVMPVPKDFKASRMIAPETPWLNLYASRVRELLLDLVSITGWIDVMPPEDQGRNRMMAKLGSLGPDVAHAFGTFCTIDLKNASDSIVRELFFAVFPAELYNVVRRALADWLLVRGEWYETHILATSGSVLTPILQSIFYLGILRTAYQMCGIKDPADQKKLIGVYNDDLVVVDTAFETCVQMLQRFHLVVSERKTFSGSNKFRESCGGEYYNGYDVTGLYWPRKALRFRGKHNDKPTAETIDALVALQHRLASRGMVSADAYLSSFLVRKVGMTYSPMGSECDDLWCEWLDEHSSMCQSHKVKVQEWNDPYLNSVVHFSCIDTGVLGAKAMDSEAYFRFLKDGPTYATPLDELLHVSEGNLAHEHSMDSSFETYKTRTAIIRPKR